MVVLAVFLVALFPHIFTSLNHSRIDSYIRNRLTFHDRLRAVLVHILTFKSSRLALLVNLTTWIWAAIGKRRN